LEDSAEKKINSVLTEVQYWEKQIFKSFSCMRRLLLSSLLFIGYFAYSQRADSVLITEFPLREGRTFLFFDTSFAIVDPPPFIMIESDSNRVFSINNGVVENILEKDSAYFVTIKTKWNKYITYGFLERVNCKIGEKVKRNQIIGLLKFRTANNINTLFFKLRIRI
jgi:hypothetical protein